MEGAVCEVGRDKRKLELEDAAGLELGGVALDLRRLS